MFKMHLLVRDYRRMWCEKYARMWWDGWHLLAGVKCLPADARYMPGHVWLLPVGAGIQPADVRNMPSDARKLHFHGRCN